MGRNKTGKNRPGAPPSRTSLKKDPGIPAFKNNRSQMAAAADRKMAKMNGVQQKRRRLDEEEMDTEMTPAPAAAAATLSSSIAALASAVPSSSTFDFASTSVSSSFLDVPLDDTLTGRRDSSLKAYMREFRKVLDLADVLIEVLDARDPLGCRSRETERLVMREGKKVILVLNKIDLVPRQNVEAWLKYLRNDFPTLAFKSSTQQQRTHLSQSSASTSTSTNLGASEALGADALVQLLKNYSRHSKSNLKTSLSVGVFGMPNVGKSSLINSLKRAKVCGVASTPGHTKVAQSVVLDKGLKLVDCPGIVFMDEAAMDVSGEGEEARARRARERLLRNVVKVELVEDPIAPVEAILDRVDAEHLCRLYGIDGFKAGDVQDFLVSVALGRGRLGKGGVPDISATARSILRDWNTGRIAYCTVPPAAHPSATRALSAGQGEDVADASTAGEAGMSVVSSFGEAFDLAALLGEADAQALQGSGALLNGDGEPMMEDDVEDEAVNGQKRKRSMSVSTTDTPLMNGGSSLPGSVVSLPPRFPAPSSITAKTSSQSAQMSRMFSPAELELMSSAKGAQRRKAKKEKKRREKVGAGLAQGMETMMMLDDEDGAGRFADGARVRLDAETSGDGADDENDEALGGVSDAGTITFGAGTLGLPAGDDDDEEEL